MMLKTAIPLAFSTLIGFSSAFDNQCNNNIVGYWGQNSYGAAHPENPSGWQQPLRYYCEDDTIDTFPIAFLTTFFSVGGKPEINLSNYCTASGDGVFPGTNLAMCQKLAPDIKYCQSKGKPITLSLGGATAGAGFQTADQASEFADTVWNLFLGGESDIRPFGDAVLDGIDLDIEGGGPNHYDSFLKKLGSYFEASGKKYYVTAAPQCPYPDASLEHAINSYSFDAVYVQFYNNYCGLQNFDSLDWNFGTWDLWARKVSLNPNVKVLIGAPASQTAAGSGYTEVERLITISKTTQGLYPSFGGVMFWDVSQAYKNNRIDAAVKSALQSDKRCDGSFDYPLCTAPAFQNGQTYNQGDKVSHEYMWIAKWWAANPPSIDTTEWAPVSSCKGGSGDNGSFKLAMTTTITKTVTKTVINKPSATCIAGCFGVPNWSSSRSYETTNQVTYQGTLWGAQWSSYNEVPGSVSSAWARLANC